MIRFGFWTPNECCEFYLQYASEQIVLFDDVRSRLCSINSNIYSFYLWHSQHFPSNRAHGRCFARSLQSHDNDDHDANNNNDDCELSWSEREQLFIRSTFHHKVACPTVPKFILIFSVSIFIYIHHTTSRIWYWMRARANDLTHPNTLYYYSYFYLFCVLLSLSLCLSLLFTFGSHERTKFQWNVNTSKRQPAHSVIQVF